jgi:hypothetical protein
VQAIREAARKYLAELASTRAQVSVLDPPSVRRETSETRWVLELGARLVLALVAGVGLALLLHLWDGRLYTTAEVEAALHSIIDTLVEDGMLAFGMASYVDDKLEEVFIDDHKMIRVFTSKGDVVRSSLESAGLRERPDLEFLTEHGHTHLGLRPDTDDIVQRHLFKPLAMERQSSQ